MKSLSQRLLVAYNDTLKSAGVPERFYGVYRKWLRFYLDFCARYNHPPRDQDSLAPFLQKLAS